MTNQTKPDKINIYVYILKYILIYKYYTKYNQYIDLKIIKDKYRDLYLVYEQAIALLEKFQRDITLDELKVSFFASYPNLKEEQHRVFDNVFSSLDTFSLSEDVVVDVFEQLRQRNVAYNISNEFYQVSEGARDWDKAVQEVRGLLEERTVESPFEFVTDDLNEILAQTMEAPGLRWRLDSLNKMLGSLRKGNFGFIVARPETGKTTFLASEVTYMAQQATGPILWFNNEQAGAEVKSRLFQAALGMTTPQIASDRAKCIELYKQLTGHKIKVIDEAIIHRRDVETTCESLQPSLIIFDQLDKIYGFDADRNDLVLGKIYQWARELAKKYCPVIGVCQADATADGVQWLTMNHVADAKTSKQAEADWILGIGKTYRDGYEYIRHLHLSKNKLLGDPDTLQDLRHGKRDVIIQPEIARYKDI